MNTTSFLASASQIDPTLTLFGGLVLLILVFWFFASERDRSRKRVGLVVMAAIVVFSLLSVVSPNNWGDLVTGKKKFSEVHNLKRGIDIAGGASFVLEIKPGDNGEKVTAASMAEVQKVLLKRLATVGYDSASVTPRLDKNQIEVQVPDVTAAEAKIVRNKLEEVAELNIYKVSRNSHYLVQKHTDPETGVFNKEACMDDEEFLNERIFPHTFETNDGETVNSFIITEREVAITGEDVKRATADVRTGKAIHIDLTSKGGEKNEAFTLRMQKGVDRIAIIFDGRCLSAPTQQADKLGASFQITGMKNLDESRRIAANMVNPLKNKPEIVQERRVSATLGEATISQGIKAGLAGLGLTLVFIVLYYKLAGIIALCGLVINILVIFGSMALIDATLTLPGIAGVILTIGVAVDANVLIYERLREEREHGKSYVEALRTAYEKAFSAIIDANITTLITAVILFAMATGSVQGFAVTLTIGIAGTLLASLLCTRVLFWYGGDFGIVKDAKFMNLIPKRQINFLSKAKGTLVISAILIAASIAITAIRGKDSLGVDFTGGTNIEFALTQEVAKELTQPQIAAALKKLDLSKDASSQIASAGLEEKIISVNCSELVEEKELVEKTVRSLHPGLTEKQPGDSGAFVIEANASKISSSMGDEFFKSSLIAIALGLVGILVYITLRFEFSFAVGAFFALAHDIIVVLGLLIVTGQEISMIHVGAFLTIAGYSINDTIVVFDRIRENLTLSEDPIHKVMNTAISSTLSRTILTSVTTFVAVLVLYVFGGTALSDFAFTIMAGVLVGTYSSIFVAAPIVNYFSKARGNDLRQEIIDAKKLGEEEELEEDEEGELNPA